MPHSASTIIGRGVSFARAFKNSGRAYRIGFVDTFKSFGGHGGGGSGFEYRTRTNRSSLELSGSQSATCQVSTQVTDLFFELIVLIVGRLDDQLLNLKTSAIAHSGRFAKRLVNTDQQISRATLKVES